MAADKLTYPTKVDGDPWTHQEANSIKLTINEHADELDALQAAKLSILSSISGVAGDVTRIETALAGVAAGTTVAVQTGSDVTIHPGVLNVWEVAMASLTVAFAGGTAGHVAEYMMKFTVAGSSFTLTLPSGVRWVEDPDFTDGYTYEIDIQDGIALFLELEPAEGEPEGEIEGEEVAS